MNRFFFQTVLISSLSLFGVACSYTERITDGATAMQRKQYAVAAKFFEKQFSKSQSKLEKARIAYQLAECYRRYNQTSSEKKWLEKANELNYGADAQAALAEVFRREENYPKAAKLFEQAGRERGEPGRYRSQITGCAIAQEWLKDANTSAYKVQNLPNINSLQNDLSPTVFGDKLIFSSDREGASKANYKWTGNDFFDIFIAENEQVKPLPAPIKTEFNEGATAFNELQKELFFTRCGTETTKEGVDLCKILVCQQNGNDWTSPKIPGFVVSGFDSRQPSINATGDELIFALKREDATNGFDLAITKRTPEGWAKPVNLGEVINTKGNEVFPFLDKDTLYFSSDGHIGMGGLDIFKSVRVAGIWQPPINLKAPLNSGEDDFGFMINHTAPKSDSILHLGYFSSSRRGGNGGDDIYLFTQKKPKSAPPLPIPKIDSVKNIVYRISLKINSLEKVFQEKDNPNTKIKDFRPIENVEITAQRMDTTFRLQTNENGFVTIPVKEGQKYQFSANKKGYFNGIGNFEVPYLRLTPENPTATLETEIVLDKIFEDKEIVLNNIYYDYNEAKIRGDAEPTLNELAKILLQNPNIHIQLSSHTDCRGKDSYNEILSQRRAEAAVNFLIGKGIAAERLIAKGYGESLPTTACECNSCSEDEHQTNRRTTFKVLKN